MPSTYSVRLVNIELVLGPIHHASMMTMIPEGLLLAFRARHSLVLENLALRHQIVVLQRSSKRPRLKMRDRVFWVLLSRIWSGWRESLSFVKPETVIRWHRRGFRLYWTWKSRRKGHGRPAVHSEVRQLICRMSQAWRTFLDNHVRNLVSVDFFTVTTVTFKVLFVFVVLAHDRRRVIHFNVTGSPAAQWTAQQIVEAFPWDTAPRYLLRDRDGIYGHEFVGRVRSMGIREVMTAPRSPWQSPYVERLIGTLRRDCLDQVIVLSENHLRRIVRGYLDYYHSCRTHLSFEKDSPEPRPVEPPNQGRIVEIPMVGRLHYRYARLTP